MKAKKKVGNSVEIAANEAKQNEIQKQGSAAVKCAGNNSSADTNESSEGISHVMSMKSAAAISLEKQGMRMKKLAARREGVTENLTGGSVVRMKISDSDKDK